MQVNNSLKFSPLLKRSVAYDFTAQTRLLLERGADKQIKNGDGNKAIDGTGEFC